MDIASFKQANPDYKDVPDLELADALHAKYYSDVPRDQFLQQVGVAGQQTNQFGTSMPRDQYQQSFLAMNPNADQGALDMAMSAYDKDAATRSAAGQSKVQDRLAALQSPERMFDARLNKRLQQHTSNVNAARPDHSAPGVVPDLPGRQEPDKLAAPWHKPTTFEETAGSAMGGFLKTLIGSVAAGAAMLGDDKMASEWDAGREQVDQRMKEMGSESLTGRVSEIIGSVAPALFTPESLSAQLATNTGLFGIPAFRDSYRAQIAAGHGQDVALEHAIAAAGLNVALPMVAPGGMRALSKAVGTADLAGAKGAAASLGLAAAEGAGFSAISTATDKGIDTLNGVQNDNPWFDGKDLAANAIAFAGLRVPHAAAVGLGSPAEAPRTTAADIANAKTMDEAISAATAAVPNIAADGLRSNNETVVADLLRQIRPIEQGAPRVEAAPEPDIEPQNIPENIPAPGMEAVHEQRLGEQPGEAALPQPAVEAELPPRVADAGIPLDENWHAFPENSGSLGVPRAEMPQIDSAHHGALVNYLNARGVAHEPMELAPETLKPTQAEFSPEKVARSAENPSDRSVLVSADGHVLDGHHQWLAHMEQGTPVKAIRLNAPISVLIQHAHEFPSSRVAEGAKVPEDAAQFFKPGEFTTEQGAAIEGQPPIEAAPRALTERERVAAMRDVAVLNKSLEQVGMEPVKPLRDIPTGQHALAAEVAKTFGTTVRFVSGHPGFEGVAHNGVAYLTDKMKYPALAIAGHEVFHTMEQSHPELADKLMAHVQEYLHPDAVERRQQWEQIRSPTEVTPRHALSEVVADLHGAMWVDPQFWRELAAKDESLFRQTAYRFVEVVTRAIESLRGTRLDPESMVTDVAKVRSLIADAWVERNGKHITEDVHATDRTDRAAGDRAAAGDGRADGVGTGADRLPADAGARDATEPGPQAAAHIPDADRPADAQPALKAKPPRPDATPDDLADVPIGFVKRTKVEHEVWVEDEGVYETVKIPADQALASVREDIANLRSLLDCLGA